MLANTDERCYHPLTAKTGVESPRERQRALKALQISEHVGFSGACVRARATFTCYRNQVRWAA